MNDSPRSVRAAADRAIDPVLARLAVADLAPTDPIRADDLDALLDQATRHHVLAFVRRSTSEGLIANADRDFRTELERRARAAAATTLAGHAALVDAVRKLRSAGLDPIALKGCATGHLDHERPHARFTSDADVLVPPDTLLQVRAAGLGTEPAFRGERWQHRFAKSTTFLDAHAKEIDVHQRLVLGYFGWVLPMEDLLAHTEPLCIGGAEMRALDGPSRLIHAAVHATTRNAGMHSVRDVPQLVLGSGVDAAVAIERAEQWGVDVPFAAGVRRAWAMFGLEPHPLADWSDGVVGGRRARAAWWLTDQVWNGDHFAALLALPVRDWLGYAWPILAPSPGYLAHQRVSARERLARMARKITGRA